MIPSVFQIERRLEEYPDTVTLQLMALSDPGPAQILPGQFNMLYAFGCGEVPISSAACANQGSLLSHTIRAQGAATRAICGLREGQQLGVRGPFGSGWPLERSIDREVLIIAGGIGLAPLRPVIESLLRPDAEIGGVRIFYGARTPETLLYRDDIQRWGSDVPVQVSVDHAGRDWRGHIGVITDPLDAAVIDPAETVAFICGPEIMMRFCLQLLLNKGMDPSDIYLSMERNMKCAVGHCGHCQWGPNFVCRQGPVFCYEDVQGWFDIRAL